MPVRHLRLCAALQKWDYTAFQCDSPHCCRDTEGITNPKCHLAWKASSFRSVCIDALPMSVLSADRRRRPSAAIWDDDEWRGRLWHPVTCVCVCVCVGGQRSITKHPDATAPPVGIRVCGGEGLDENHWAKRADGHWHIEPLRTEKTRPRN